MVNKDLTHLYWVLDRSGSMDSCKDDTIGGFNAYIRKQRELPGECRVTLAQFDTEYEMVYANLPLADVPPLRLEPRNGTALLDAIGRTINDAGHGLSGMPEHARPGAVIVGILTDGLENSSHEFTLERVRSMIEHQQNNYQWVFIYIGANQDAIRVGGSMGIPRGSSLSYNTANTNEVFAALATNTSNYRTGTMAGLGHAESFASATFTDEQRAQALKEQEDAKGTSTNPKQQKASKS